MKKLTICACSSRSFIKREEVAKVVVAARKAGWEVEILPDLCELCENNDPRLHDVAKTVVVACHQRAVKALMAFVGEDNCLRLSLRETSAAEVLGELKIKIEEDTETEALVVEQVEKMPRKPGEDAWYPTIDKDVCGECGKCFDFCPFGVYEMIDDRVRVVHPHNCKNNCPACARTCPHSAIIFPKYDRSPINGGEERQEKAVQLDSRSLYNDAFRMKLAQRRAGVSLLKKK